MNEGRVLQGGEIEVKKVRALQLPGSLGQPRRYFDEARLKELEESIKLLGVFEPIVVRLSDDGFYEVLSGERRWRCCIKLGIEKIPYQLVEADDKRALEIALLAQVMREGVSRIEETDSIMGLLSLKLDMDFEALKPFLQAIANTRARNTRSQLLEGREREAKLAEEILDEFKLKIGSFVNNRIPLLDMPDYLLDAVRNGNINPTNASFISKQPEEIHGALLEQGHLSKGRLRELARSLLEEGAGPDGSMGKRNDPPIQETVFSRLEAVKAASVDKELWNNRVIKERMKRIAKELEDIEAIIKRMAK